MLEMQEHMQEHKSTPAVHNTPLHRPCSLLYGPLVPCSPSPLHFRLVFANAVPCKGTGSVLHVLSKDGRDTVHNAFTPQQCNEHHMYVTMNR